VEEDRDHKAWVAVLVQKLEDGTPLDLAPGEDVDLTQAAGWPESRRMPGEALRAALLEPNVNPDPRGLRIRGAYITGITDLADLQVSCGLHFDSCAFGQTADWSRVTVVSLRLTDCTAPSLTLNEAHIGGVLVLRGATLTNAGGDALSLDGADIKGGAFLDPVTVTGKARALGASIGGQLSLRGATLTNAGGIALSLDRADIKGSAFLDPVTVTGEVRALGASISGVLNLRGATLTNAGGDALSLEGADIKGGAFLDPVTVTGEVRALGASIGGVLSLRGATLTNAGGIALSLDRADIKGEVFLDPVTVTGEVRALGASIGGQLSLRGATLTNAGEDALSLDGADIKGNVFLNPVTVTGAARALGTTIGGQLNLRGATLTNVGGIALAFQSARLNVVFLTPQAVKGGLALDAAQISVLITPDDKNDMNVLIGSELSASGWRLSDVRGRIRHDKKAAADWLSRDNAKEFVPQPWHELANVYERNGQPADARWLRLKAARGVTRTSHRGPKPIRWLYDALTGHGYYPLRAAVWLILAIATSGIIVAANQGVFTPTATNKAAWKTPPPVGQPAPPITGATPCEDLQDRSSCLKPGLYALDNTLPGTLATGQAAQWTANGAQGWNMWVPYVLGGLKIASWILVALLLAGVTGLLRKT
jgi:uncharacterized protein YjbI with pentapeptide repeats